MPSWYYEKKGLKSSPSIKDAIDFETERRYRREGARFIMQTGTSMGLGHNALATGIVYFHRFYMFHSFKTFPRYVTACCCLFLAGKVEETPKKCRDIIKTAKSLLSEEKFLSFGEDPKEEVMTLERILLQTIKFDLQVEHPYTFLVKYAKCLRGDNTKLEKMVQMAWNFVNDSLSTTVCLQWEPEIIAVALIHLASKLSKFTVVDWVGKTSHHLRWWDVFVADVTMEILEDICHQVLDLYQTNQNAEVPESPPQIPTTKASPPSTQANHSSTQSQLSPGIESNSRDMDVGGKSIPSIVTDTLTQPHYGFSQPQYGGYPPTYATLPPPVPPGVLSGSQVQPIYGTQYPVLPHTYSMHPTGVPPGHPPPIPPQSYYAMPQGRPYYHPAP